MQFKSLLALFTMIVAVVAAPAMDDHKTHDLHKVNDFDDGKENASDDHSVKNEVDIEADDHSSNDKDDHSNSCGENQTSMCCDSFNKKDVNGLELLLGQGCIANVLGCNNQAACCKQEGGGLSLIQICELL